MPLPFITSNGPLLYRVFLACGFYLSLHCNLTYYFKLNWLIGKASLFAILYFFTDFMKLDNADKDFLKLVKEKHPSLTPNDLKLCAYSRLNLASKEIAPLLNISPRSVEVTRYRLRKKMNLAPKSSFTNYILGL